MDAAKILDSLRYWHTSLADSPKSFHAAVGSLLSDWDAAKAVPPLPQPREDRCPECKSRNVLLLAITGHLDKVKVESMFDGVECARLRIAELEAQLAASAESPLRAKMKAALKSASPIPLSSTPEGPK